MYCFSKGGHQDYQVETLPHRTCFLHKGWFREVVKIEDDPYLQGLYLQGGPRAPEDCMSFELDVNNANT